MSNATDEREKRFWNRYIALLEEYEVKPTTYRWYIQHCEQFIRCYTEIRLKSHTQETLSQYLSSILENAHLKPWQKRQAFDALKFLFLSIRSPLCNKIDWEYWKMSCKELERDHVTLARNNMPIRKQLNSDLDTKGNTHNGPEIEKLIYVIRAKGFSIRTEKTYVHWVNRFLKFNANLKSETLDDKSVVTYLSYLAVDKGVSSATQALALNAISFYFKSVLAIELGDLSAFVKAKKRHKLPVILTSDEVKTMLNDLTGVQLLLVSLLYGGGLRLMEAVRLRI